MTVRSLKVTACAILRSGRRRKISSVGDFIESKILRGVYPEPRVEILRRPSDLAQGMTQNDRKRKAQNEFLRNQNVSRETFFSSLFFLNVLETKESLYIITY